MYMAAISACHVSFDGVSPVAHPLNIHFLKGESVESVDVNERHAAAFPIFCGVVLCFSSSGNRVYTYNHCYIPW